VADYSQVELRILASLTGDQNLIDAFLNGEDIHMRTARFLFGDNVTISGDMRRQAKAVNFGVIYGITGF
jgi:DNA polymerase-1